MRNKQSECVQMNVVMKCERGNLAMHKCVLINSRLLCKMETPELTAALRHFTQVWPRFAHWSPLDQYHVHSRAIKLIIPVQL